MNMASVVTASGAGAHGTAMAEEADENERADTEMLLLGLPKSIFLDVIGKLPMKDAATCRSVCKAWKTAAALASPAASLRGGRKNTPSISLRLLSLHSVFPRVESIHISRNEVPIASVLARFVHLKDLKINDCQKPQSAPHDFFAFLTGQLSARLERLEVSSCSFTWNLDALSGMTCLRTLRCYGNAALHGNTRCLRALKGRLVSLRLARCPFVTGAADDLADFYHLQCLELSGEDATRLLGPPFEDLGSHFPNLAALSLSVCMEDSDAAHADVGSLSSLKPVLRKLHISGKKITGSLADFVGFIKLEEMYLMETNIKGSLETLRGLSCLRSLVLLGSHFAGDVSDLFSLKLLQRLELGPEIRVCAEALEKIGPYGFPLLEKVPRVGSPWRVDDVGACMNFLFERNGDNFDQIAKIQKLHCDSPDRYEYRQDNPFSFETVVVSSRVGWRWCTTERWVYDAGNNVHRLDKTPNYFETNWLNAEPEPNEEGYDKYLRAMTRLRAWSGRGPFVGMFRPPVTLAEYEECLSHHEAERRVRSIERLEKKFFSLKTNYDRNL